LLRYGLRLLVQDAEFRDDLRRGERAVAEGREEGLDVVHVQIRRRLGEVVRGEIRERMLRDALQLLVQELLAVGDVLLALLPLEPLADLLARTGSADDGEPVPRGAARRLAGDDLDDVARRERVVE